MGKAISIMIITALTVAVAVAVNTAINTGASEVIMALVK